MSDYHRTTRECSVNQLHPELHQAIRGYFQEHGLGDLDAETQMCCETISEKKSAGRLFSWMNDKADTTIHTGILLTPEWLIWARCGDKSGTLITAANLKHISVEVYTSILTKDTGLEVIGYIEGPKGPMRGYIGMGPEFATQKLGDEIKQAIIRVNPPTQKKWPRWMGG